MLSWTVTVITIMSKRYKQTLFISDCTHSSCVNKYYNLKVTTISTLYGLNNRNSKVEMLEALLLILNSMYLYYVDIVSTYFCLYAFKEQLLLEVLL